MRIGMVLDHEFPPDIRVENEIISLTNADFDVFLLSLNFKSKNKFGTYHGAKIKRIKKSKFWIKKFRALTNTILNYYPKFWAKHIINFINEYDIDVLHIHDLYMFGAGLLARKKIKKPIKIVSDLHENYVDGLKHYNFANTFPGNILISISKWRKKEIEWCNKADYLITVIDEAVERYNSLGIHKEKITVVANYVNQKEFLSPIKLGAKDNSEILQKFKDKFVITYTGGFDLHRGLECVVKSIPYVIDTIPNLKIVLVGRGKNFDSLQKMVKDLNIEKYVSFEGWQLPHYLPSYIKASNVCLIPHLKTIHTDNTIPHKLFHYMLLEKPVISSNCNPIKRILDETKAGIIYKSNDEKQLADKIINLYKNKRLREKMGGNGKEAVLEKYNWENTSKNLIRLYEKIGEAINES